MTIYHKNCLNNLEIVHLIKYLVTANLNIDQKIYKKFQKNYKKKYALQYA